MKCETPSISVYCSRSFAGNRAALEKILPSVQERLFDQLGVIAPQIELRESAEIPDNLLQLQVNGKRLPPFTDPSLTEPDRADALVDALVSRLSESAAAILTADLTEWYLEAVQTAYPALADATLAEFDVQTLTDLLQKKLAKQVSIRDMVSILEGFLEEKALGKKMEAQS